MAAIIGLTGGIASGKSTVSSLLKEKGFTVIDADVAARIVVQPGEEAYKKIVETFGKDILLENGEINRPKLGDLVFRDEQKRLQLNAIVHPAVRKQMLLEKEQAIRNGKQTIFLDIPLLFESGLTWMVDKTIVVYVDENIQLQRLMKRNGLDKEAAEIRISAQMPLEEKASKADAVINNNGTITETKKQLEHIIEIWALRP
ncbi:MULTISPECIES: dephospho-CoA kinase [Bacillus]|jgi:dephospho-CoA kinase|uniref:Dephospho-CoA kinase n=1 Tax=Bacillus smithii 7_3_47FAA TaxID=665952 RepID=G9QQD9_9BACI|nr:dephospho-CoA kinase [Bacillus smithii]EHL73116.1 dephospho-CoA kinase [Bacillus smithii 7_3_47FAA]MED0658917.1 dephospho-CoA kinase [Bacillus smithii]MED1418526.1 dephospho-CoA kinase [Bacillus smithii]MED1455905.1 dephospho-CoA kinase [Bacillus smithii]MED4884900.1 dephospho-CoA kinase [Bacillus smithii]